MPMERKQVDVNTPWRKTAAVIYDPITDGRTFGTFDIDITETLKFVEKARKKGHEITITQVLLTAVGKTLYYKVPEINAYIQRGRIIARETADIFVSIDLPDTSEITGFTMREIEKKSVLDVHREMAERVEKYRKRQETGAAKSKNFLATIPWPFRRSVFQFIRFFTVTLGLKIPPLKLDASAFGACIFSNIGQQGLRYGMASIMPVSNLPLVVLMGAMGPEPVVRNGKVVIRDILPMSATLDHRLIDGPRGGKLAVGVDEYCQDPERLLEREGGHPDTL